jgi:nucleoid-associated protein YgaU
VRAGDSFYSIARDVLGDASRWRELLELNSALVDGEPTNLRVGQVVQLPAEVSGSGR